MLLAKAMVHKPTPCFLDRCEYLGFVHGDQRWRSKDHARLYTWDSLHGEIEIFNRRGRHLGVGEAVECQLIKPAVKGRKIDV